MGLVTWPPARGADTWAFALCAAVQKQGLTHGEACKNFWIVDKQGLVTEERPALSAVVKPFARYRNQGDVDGERLLDTIKRVPSPP